MSSNSTVTQTAGMKTYLTVLARISPWLVVAICMAVVLVFVLLAPYAHPSTDDLCLANGIRRDGLINHLWKHYFEWSGRYSGNALYGVYPLIFGMFEGYRYIPVIIIASLFIASLFFIVECVYNKIV